MLIKRLRKSLVVCVLGQEQDYTFRFSMCRSDALIDKTKRDDDDDDDDGDIN